MSSVNVLYNYHSISILKYHFKDIFKNWIDSKGIGKQALSLQ